MANLDQIQLPDNTTYDIISKTGRGVVRATMNNTTSTSTAFVVEASGITSLYDGLTIVVKNTKVASASGCTLQLNDLAAKRIIRSSGGGYVTTHWALNTTYLFVYSGTNDQWEMQQGYLDGNTNTWRGINVDGTTLLGTGTGTGAINFVSGSNVTLTGSGNDLTIAATDTTYTGTGAISVNSSTHVISTTAEANQNAFSNVKVGSTTIAADSKTDTLELAAGSNVTLTPDATNDTITIDATDTTYSDATTSASGLMSASDKTKLNRIPTNGYSDWAYISPSNVTNISGSAGNQRYLATITVPAHTLRLYDIAVDLTKGADGGQADLVVSTTKGATTSTGSTPSGAGDAFQYTAKTIAPCPATGNFLIKLSTQIRNNTASNKTYQLNLRRYLGGTGTLTAITRYSQIEYPA